MGGACASVGKGLGQWVRQGRGRVHLLHILILRLFGLTYVCWQLPFIGL